MRCVGHSRMMCSRRSTMSALRTFQGLDMSWHTTTAFRRVMPIAPSPTFGPCPSNTWHGSSTSGIVPRSRGTTTKHTWHSAPSLRPPLPHPQGVVRHVGDLVPRLARGRGSHLPSACAPCRRVRVHHCVGTTRSPRGVVPLPLGRVLHRGLPRGTHKARVLLLPGVL